MKRLFKEWGMVGGSAMAGLVVALLVARCGSDSATVLNYGQVERLGRPGINEALVTKNSLLNAYNSVAPTVDLSASTVLASAADTLKALYAGACYLAGLSGWSTVLAGAKPAGVDCAATGTSILGSDGKLSSTFIGSSTSGATKYINTVVEGFIPDVLRIDTSVTSGYGSATCQGSGKGTMLCGGRTLTDDVIQITYSYLLTGLNVTLDDNVTYAGANTSQGHTSLRSTFPYAPAPH